MLPTPRHSPPPSSPQKVHGTLPTAPPQSDPSQLTHPTAKFRATAEAPASASGSMSTMTLATPKPAPRRGTPPVHLSSPDTMDVDVQGMSPEPDGQADTTAGPGAGQDRDGDSEAIIRQLEKSLPRWEGFGDLGWMSEVTQVCSCRPLHCDTRRGEGASFPFVASFCVFFSFFFRIEPVCVNGDDDLGYYAYRSDDWKSCWRSRATRTACTSCR